MISFKPLQTTWNLTPLFASDTDPEILKQRKIIEQKAQEFIKKWQSRNDYLKDPRALKLALTDYEKYLKNYGIGTNEAYYFSLRQALDQVNPDIKAKFNQAADFSIKLANSLQFFELKISKIDPKLHEKFLSFKDLQEYKHFLERLFAQSKYQLTEPEERILNLITPTSYSNWIKMTSTFISREQRISPDDNGRKKLQTLEQLLTLTSSKKTKVRDEAAKNLNDIFLKNSDIAQEELNSVLGHKKVNDDLRGYERPDSQRHLGDDIDTNIIDSLVESVSKRFKIAQRFYKLKSQLFKVRKLKYHERNIEYGTLKSNYPFKDSVTLIYQVFHNLDPQFAEIFKKFIEGGQVDVSPKKGKRGGAFCTDNLLTQPTYVLLNHTHKFRDVLTIAHEFGHAIHSELSRGQNALNYGFVMSTAEVASTFMEDFVLQELFKKASKKDRLSLMIMKLQDDINTIFRQIACYKFEQDLHAEFRKKGYLSKEEIGQIFQKNMSAYMGPFVEQSKGSENWWVYWSHIRTYFYVYSYASGLLISKSLQNQVKKNPYFIEKVKEFLSAGLSDSPKNIFSKLSIDIEDKNFWDKGLDEIESLLKETEKLAKQLKKI